MIDQLAVTSKDIQTKYIKLYKFLMQYLWEYSTVEALANLELECYRMFPDKELMLKYLKELKRKIESTYNELTEDDKPEFENIFTQFEKLIEDYDPDNAETELYSVNEPIELSSSDDKENNSDREDRIYKFGSIEKIEFDEGESAEEAENSEESVEEDKLANPFEEE